MKSLTKTSLKFLAVYLVVNSVGLSVMLIRRTHWQDRRVHLEDTITEFEMDMELCGCKRNNVKVFSPNQHVSSDGISYNFEDTTCGTDAFARGSGQKVVSYVFYVNPKSSLKEARVYFEGIEENLELMLEYYPGWVLRLYTDSPRESVWLESICQIACNNSHMDICHAKDLPGNPLKDATTIYPMLWRFFPTLDPQVDIFVSRDLDSRFSARELSAVDVWLEQSKMPIVSMLDHPRHAFPIMGGAWGSHNLRLKVRDLWSSTWPMILNDPESQSNSTLRRGPDQRLLRSLVWDRWAFNMTLQFNGFRCTNFTTPGWSASPWPTQREALVPNNFVGANVSKNRTMWIECPVECRPQEHKDWIYC